MTKELKVYQIEINSHEYGWGEPCRYLLIAPNKEEAWEMILKNQVEVGYDEDVEWQIASFIVIDGKENGIKIDKKRIIDSESP